MRISSEAAVVDLITSARLWWQRERQNSGAATSVCQFFALGWQFIRESMPDRRRQRYGDVDYDWEYRVDTTSATLGLRTRFRGLLHSPYQPVEPELFHAMMKGLDIDFSKFTFIDIGSGKGRALLLASEYGFDRIVGIELLSELNQIARENIRKFSSRLRRSLNIEAVLGDATKFRFPPAPVVVFLFHPLPESDFRQLLVNLTGSLLAFPRPAYLAYAHPAFAPIVDDSHSFEKIAATHQYSLFRNS